MDYNRPIPKSIEEVVAGFLPVAQGAADQLFGSLDDGFLQRVHVITVPTGFLSTFEEVTWYSSDGQHTVPTLNAARAFSAEQHPDGSERTLDPANPYVSDTVFHSRRARAFLVGKIGELEAATTRTTFVSDSVSTNELRQAFVILRLDRTAWARYRGRGDGSPSLISEVADTFLERVMQYLTDQFRIDSTEIPMPRAAELLRAAAARLIDGVRGPAAGEIAAEDLLETLDAVAAITYEKAENHGRILLSTAPHCTEFLRLERPVDLRRSRAMRKLLEMTSARLALAVAGREATALIPLADTGLPDGAVAIDFGGRHRWELRVADEVLMRVEAGVPDVPRPKMRRDDFDEAWLTAFGAVSDHAELVWSVAEAAMEQRHGTLLVVSPAAPDEAQRLGQASTTIAPSVLNAELVRAVTSVDGAILLDLEGQCHAVGVILDGLVSERGDPGRGARFNSALRYVDTRFAANIAAIAVVISEDGSVEVVAPQVVQVAEAVLPI
jgi:hypothetical protein